MNFCNDTSVDKVLLTIGDLIRMYNKPSRTIIPTTPTRKKLREYAKSNIEKSSYKGKLVFIKSESMF